MDISQGRLPAKPCGRPGPVFLGRARCLPLGEELLAHTVRSSNSHRRSPNYSDSAPDTGLKTSKWSAARFRRNPLIVYNSAGLLGSIDMPLVRNGGIPQDPGSAYIQTISLAGGADGINTTGLPLKILGKIDYEVEPFQLPSYPNCT